MVASFGKAVAYRLRHRRLGRFYCRNCKDVELEAGRRCLTCGDKWTDNREPEYHGKLFHDFRRTAARNMVRLGHYRYTSFDS